jgi:hypothetical protein
MRARHEKAGFDFDGIKSDNNSKTIKVVPIKPQPINGTRVEETKQNKINATKSREKT